MLLVPAAAQAFERTRDPYTHACLFWTRRDVSWALNEDGVRTAPMPDVVAALERSFDTWQSVPCSDMAFSFDGLTPRRDVGFDEKNPDNVNLLVFREERCRDPGVVPDGDECFSQGDCGDKYGCWDHPDAVIALTFTHYVRRLGIIVDADIEFNAASFRFTATTATTPACRNDLQTECVSTDLQNTATHEIGHLLGFDHSPLPLSTMYASAPNFETRKRWLIEDDVQGLCEVYPAGASVRTCSPTGTIGIQPTDGCGCSEGGGAGLAALLLACLGLVRRKRPWTA